MMLVFQPNDVLRIDRCSARSGRADLVDEKVCAAEEGDGGQGREEVDVAREEEVADAAAVYRFESEN